MLTVTGDLNLEGSQPFSSAQWAASDLGLPAQARIQGSGVPCTRRVRVPGAPVLRWDKSLTSLCLRCPRVRTWELQRHDGVNVTQLMCGRVRRALPGQWAAWDEGRHSPLWWVGSQPTPRLDGWETEAQRSAPPSAAPLGL